MKSKIDTKRVFAYFGPAYLVSVGYMDPGNWATDIAGGSRFGYSLIWVLLMSNLIALLLQGLSARLGIVRGRDLAQANREMYPRTINFILYLLAEVAIAACDLAEVLGMAIGINLLTHLPLMAGVALTVLDTFLVLFLQRLGMRKLEAFILALIGIVSVAFLIEILMARPHLGAVISGFVPRLQGTEALYIAIGIIGATVMPHNLYLHSALVQTRKIPRDEAGIRHAIKWNLWDGGIALNLAFLVNVAILVLAASVFFTKGRTDVAEIQQAYRLLAPLLGNRIAPYLFAIALIAAGQSSTVTGTLAGQIVMEGYLHLRINPWLRRLMTRLIAILPAVIVLWIYGDNEINQLIVLSQVVLSLQLAFAMIPLAHFVSDRSTMGVFTLRRGTQVLTWAVIALLVYLNLKFVVDLSTDYFSGGAPLPVKVLILAAIGGFTFLMGYTFYLPLRVRYRKALPFHGKMSDALRLDVPRYGRIAIALDFTAADEKVIGHALGQAHAGSELLLIHVVESVSARIHGQDTTDEESKEDEERLLSYVRELAGRGYPAQGKLGYTHRAGEIVRLVREHDSDLLVMGAHRHAGLQDFIHGETVNSVRHELAIPILIVNV